MSLEIEKLIGSLDQMAQAAARRREYRDDQIERIMQTLDRYAADWDAIDEALEKAAAEADPKHFRSARPLHKAPLNEGIDAGPPLDEAILIATDGSQIMPDRHAAHLYYLINIGGLVYYHGDARPPEPFSLPELTFPHNEIEAAEFVMRVHDVGVERDIKEIGTLADVAWEFRRSDLPRLAILDQRLLYWPAGVPDVPPNEDIRRWLASMTKIHDSQALLAGFIDRPMTSAVVGLLTALSGLDNPGFEWGSLGSPSSGGGLIDAVVFSYLLQPGQRSPVFTGISAPNRRFREYNTDNEVCFFYFNPGPSGHRIARVDLPRWVAEDETAVKVVHNLLYDQCQIMGGYPYVIARADEMAVIGRQDHEELNFMIDLHMQRYGIDSRLTAKQSSKGLARGGKTRHKV